ncbi:MAG: acyl-CoA dehydrogenase family protein, partial [Ilumatobacter sp.]|nr:acyl-CoA dehydrogenase family protein [Ilumatobacter sp.]
MTDTATPTALTAEEAAEFRDRCRAFLEANATKGARRDLSAAKEFQGKLAEAGLAGLSFDKEFGGAGLTLEHERIWRQVSQEFPQMTGELVISHGMCLPVLNEFGTEEQKRTYMPDNIAARTVWCQMFSEPGAGSDVASLQTKAERDGDEWIINGQKVWTTLAHESDYGVLIARTDPEQPKHAGISMFIVPLKDTPGVEIRPIHQIDGGKHFNEVFFTDLR